MILSFLHFYDREEKEIKIEIMIVFYLPWLNLQAMKKILVENFHEKDETHPQVLLYKNLWLEAEAALCSTNYMARFNKIKIEIEESKLDKGKG